MRLDLEGVEAEDLAQRLRALGWDVLPPPPESGGALGRLRDLAGWIASDPRWFGRTPEELRLGGRRLWANALGLVIVGATGLAGIVPGWVVGGGVVVSAFTAVGALQRTRARDDVANAVLFGVGAAVLGAAPVAALVGLPAALAAVVGVRPERRSKREP
jgi:hypothetical protein